MSGLAKGKREGPPPRLHGVGPGGLCLVLAVSLGFALPARGGAAGVPAALRPPQDPRPPAEDGEPPLRLAQRLQLEAMHRLGAAPSGAADELAALLAWNRSGRQPARDGFTRALPVLLAARPGGGAGSGFVEENGGWSGRSAAGRAVWGTSVEVEGAQRLRLGLRRVPAANGPRFWVWGEAGPPIPFDAGLRDPEGRLWTPSVEGPRLYFEAEWAEGMPESTFEIDQVLESLAPAAAGLTGVGPLAEAPAETSCLVDASCLDDGAVAGISTWKRAIARLSFVSGGQSFLCTGALLATTDLSFVPYLLTARSCFAGASEAASLEAVWDYLPATCGGPAPPLSGLPRSNGATLLATSPVSDFTLVRLANAPGTRSFLGWDPASGAVAPGAFLPRLSHPNGLPMAFSASAAWGPPLACADWPTAAFHYSDPAPELGFGATFPASSGAPLLLQSGQVVGQLAGLCGPNAAAPCAAGVADSAVDGRFSTSYPALAPFLAPATGTSPCVRDVRTACLLAGRFEVRVAWTTETGSGDGQVMGFGGERAESDQSAFFTFFDPANFEMGVKMVDACVPEFGNRFWIFVSGLTNQAFAVTVRDSATGRLRTYVNPLGTYPQTVGDTEGLPCE